MCRFAGMIGFAIQFISLCLVKNTREIPGFRIRAGARNVNFSYVCILRRMA